MRKVYLSFIVLLLGFKIAGAQTIYSRILNKSDSSPLPGVTVRLVISGSATFTDDQGYFSISFRNHTDTLVISSIGYNTIKMAVSKEDAFPSELIMDEDSKNLTEIIVSTGYSKINAERATGSFSYIDNSLISRSVSANILTRLEGIAPSLQFYRNTVSPHGTSSELRIRGLSTIHSETSPLIVVDNFPFEGDINSINPNDVQDITILKDAAAASIWGVRAGNGVIVITTKQGSYNQKTAVTFQSNFTLTDKPNLYYSPSFMNSENLIEFEMKRFRNGSFQKNDWTLLSPLMELQIAQEEGRITQEQFDRKVTAMKMTDVRREILKHLYQPGFNQQYSVNISGGNSQLKHTTSIGLDGNRSFNRGFSSERITLNNQIVYSLSKKLEVLSGVNYSQQKYYNNGLTKSGLNPYEGGNLAPYVTLSDDDGKASAIPYKYRETYIHSAESMSLLNWEYKPLEEMRWIDNTNSTTELRINGGINYKIVPQLNLDIKYQYHGKEGNIRQYYSPETYYVRDLVNTFTQSNGLSVIPEGGILSGSVSSGNSHYIRGQFNYNNKRSEIHSIDFLTGIEVRQDKNTSGPGYLLFGYDNATLTSAPYMNYETIYPTLPRSSRRLPNTASHMDELMDRFLSYYSNAAYTFDRKYSLTLSARWDASNIFGVSTNQKGVPLWSVGTMTDVRKLFFDKITQLNTLKVRATYGLNGNINKQVSTYPRISYGMSAMTNYPFAQLQSIGNPMLRWEKIETTNLALDFGLYNNRLSGSLDFYRKMGSDLIGFDILDPTTGIFQQASGSSNIDNRINYANIMTRGADLDLRAMILDRRIKLTAHLLLSWTSNKILRYNGSESPSILSFFPAQNSGRASVREGKSLDVLYALPWYGIDSRNGALMVHTNNELNQNYAAYWSALKMEDLKEVGVTVPTFFSSLRNTLSWKNLNVSMNLIYKGGYEFRRASINYSTLNNQNIGHADFAKRWIKPGDELTTTVPALTLTSNTTRENIYRNNETLIEDGAHIRLKDLNISYQLFIPKMKIMQISIFTYINNIGILWRANKQGLDPDYPTADFPPMRTASLGLKVDF